MKESDYINIKNLAHFAACENWLKINLCRNWEISINNDDYKRVKFNHSGMKEIKGPVKFEYRLDFKDA